MTASSTLLLMLLLPILPLSADVGKIPSLTGETPEILHPSVAFVPEIASTETGRIAVRFNIEPGYYMYRDKISLKSADSDVTLQATQTPKGILVDDEYFGESETYREEVLVSAGFSAASAITDFQITVLSQGCADIGICYPPQEQTLDVSLPAKQSIDSSASPILQPIKKLTGNKLTGSLGSLLAADNEEELLPPDIAFVPSVGSQTADIVPISFLIEDGYYLYKDKFAVRLKDAGGATIEAVGLGHGRMQEDAYFGNVEVFRHSTEISLTVAGVSANTTAMVELDYQGCADIGVCFPPQTTLLPVTLNAVDTGTGPGVVDQNSGSDSSGAKTASSVNLVQTTVAEPAPTVMAVNTKTATDIPRQSEQDRLAQSLSTSSLWMIALTFFGLGLLLAFTPCVFPMIPILSSIVVGQGESITTKKAFLLSAVYVLAMALTYTIAGVAVGLSGENVQIWFQNPWVLSAFALVFVLLSLSMFGFYELQMPAGIQQKLNNLSNKQQGGTYIGAGIMGLLSALIVGPCVTAPLVGALIFIADTGNAVVGGIALFCLSLGMGAPLLLIGTSFGKYLPRSGPWMDSAKAVFGVLMLGLAIWMLSRFVPAAVTLALTAALAIVTGIYLGAMDAQPAGTSGWKKLFKGAGLISLLYGVMLLIGSLSGGHSLLQPLKGFSGSQMASGETAHDDEIRFERVKSVNDLNEVIASAATNNQPVMLDFYADWCVSCKEMESFTFTDREVIDRLKGVVLIQADVTLNDAEDKALLKKFGLFGPPGIIFYDTGGNELRNARVVGYVPADDFVDHLNLFL